MVAVNPQNGNVDLTNGTITSPQADTKMTFDGCGNQKSLNGGGTFQVDNLNQYTTYNGAAVGNDLRIRNGVVSMHLTFQAQTGRCFVGHNEGPATSRCWRR